MFKYTKAAGNILINDFKKYAKIFRWTSSIFTIIYLTYEIIYKAVTLHFAYPVYIVLLAAFVIFTISDFFFDKYENKIARKIARRIYKWFTIACRVITLGFAIYQVYITPPSETNGISIMLTTLLILLWVLSFASEILVEVVTDRVEIMIYALKEDIDTIKKPFVSVANFGKRLIGKKIEQPPYDPKRDKVIGDLEAIIEKEKIKEFPDENDLKEETEENEKD